MWKFIFTLHLFVVFGGCQFIRGPDNTVVFVGQRLEMVCQPKANYAVREWTTKKPSSSNPLKILLNWSQTRISGNRPFGYNIDDNNTVTIHLNSTELDDAGFYECAVQEGTDQLSSYSAQVTVFDAEPVCEDSVDTAYNVTLEEGDTFWMKCGLNLSGNMVPTMEWRQHGGDGDIDGRGRIITDMVETLVVPNARISSKLSVVVDSTYNATFYTCKIYFQSDNTSFPNSNATNAPGYSYTGNSSVVIISPRAFDEEQLTTLSVSTPYETNGPTFTSPFNAIYLVAGVAVLFGIASSLVALLLCLRLRRKSSMALKNIDSGEPIESDYDLIPYACMDGYDTIEEVNEKDDILITDFAPRMGPLPLPGYAGLMPDAPKPPGVYSRIEHDEKSVDDKESEADEEKLQANQHGSSSDYSKLTKAKGSNRKAKRSSNTYLALETKALKDIAGENEEIPEENLNLSDTPVNTNSTENIQGNYSSMIPTFGSNAYLALSAAVVKDIADESDEIPSAYLSMKDASFQPNVNNNIIGPIQ